MGHITAHRELAGYSDAPRYNIQAVEKATGLSARTLRSWERRYGVPAPHRDVRGRRLYSDRDIAVIQWLMERVDQGVAVSRAVALLADEAPREEQPSARLDALQLRLLQAIDWMDEEEVTRVLSQALQTVPLDVVVSGLVQPVLYRMGDLWEAGHLSVASEHFGTHVVRSMLADLLRRSPEPWRPHHILVGCAPGEQHDVGALILALFLRHAGFRVAYLGANLEGESLKADLQRIQPHAVCLSAAIPTAAEALATLYETIGDTYHGILAYGGRAFREDMGNRVAVPGTFLGSDARQAVTSLAEALQQNETAS